MTDSEGHFTLDNLVSSQRLQLGVCPQPAAGADRHGHLPGHCAIPVGYFLSRLRVNKQHIMLMLVMLPMWMNFLLRTYAWMGLLE